MEGVAAAPAVNGTPPPNVAENVAATTKNFVNEEESRRESALNDFASHLGTQSLGHGAGGEASGGVGAGGSDGTKASVGGGSPQPAAFGRGTAASAAAARLGIQTNSVSGVAGGSGANLLSTGVGRGISMAAALGAASSAAAAGLTRLLLRDDEDPTGGAVCSLPSLDLHSGDGVDGGATMPGVGVSSKAPQAEAAPMGPPTTKVPAMAASVFGDSANGTGGAGAQSLSAATANADALKVEQAAAKNLGSRTTWTRSSAPKAPGAMLRSLASSFSSLVDSRVRAWTLLLLRHSLSSGDEESRSRLLALLATSSSIDLTAVVTTFRTLPLPEEARKQLEKEREEKQKRKAAEESCDSDATPMASGSRKKQEPDMVLPVLFEAIMDVAIQGQQVTVPLRAPGTISANFAETQPVMTYVEVKLDTNALVSSMVEQARLVVFKVVARATAHSGGAAVDGQVGIAALMNGVGKTGGGGGARAGDSGGPNDGTLSQFGSALNLSQSGIGGTSSMVPEPQQQQQQQQNATFGMSSTQMKKSMSSALRLSTILHSKEVGQKAVDGSSSKGRASFGGLHHPGDGGVASLSKVRKNRSVTWNHPIEAVKKDASNFPDAKRRKVEPTSEGGYNLASTKSFGKPDSSLFESVRNATFGEFGRVHNHSHVPSFKNGKLQVPNAYNATAQQQPSGGGGGLGGLARSGGRSMGNLAGTRNATFNALSGGGITPGSRNANFSRSSGNFSELARNAVYSQPPPGRAASTMGMALLARSRNSSQSSLPRTPTALETLLLHATSGTSNQVKSGEGGRKNAAWT